MSMNTDSFFAAAGSKTTQAGAGVATFSWFFSSEFGVFCGIVIGLLGLAVNIYFKRREDRRLQAEHEARMDYIRRRGVEP
jgi:hypothetical protein